MQQHVVDICPQTLSDPYPPDTGVKRSKLYFYHNMVMLHIELKKSQMQQHCINYFARRPPPPPLTLGMCKKVKSQLFPNMGMLHIISKRLTNAATL